jgi:hypothetical protein
MNGDEGIGDPLGWSGGALEVTTGVPKPFEACANGSLSRTLPIPIRDTVYGTPGRV